MQEDTRAPLNSEPKRVRNRKSLIEKGLIWSPRRGHVDFTVPLFAEYLRDNHPMASFAAE